MAGRHFYKDLEPSDREAFKRGRQALASYTTAGSVHIQSNEGLG